MCIECWKSYGSPKIESPKVKELSELIDVLYAMDCMGGNLHVAVDDWNIDDDTLDEMDYFIAQNMHNADADQLELEREILSLLKDCTLEERASALYFQMEHGKF